MIVNLPAIFGGVRTPFVVKIEGVEVINPIGFNRVESENR